MTSLNTKPTNAEEIDFMTHPADGPPFLELQNIQVATWEAKNQMIQRLQEAVLRNDVAQETVGSTKAMVLDVKRRIEECIEDIIQPEDPQKFALRWILEEVCVNSGISHGNEGNKSKIFEAIYGLDTKTNEVVMYIGDEGEGFDPLKVPDPTVSLARLEKSSGRGLLGMDKAEIPKLTGAQGIYLPISEGSALCREFVLVIPQQD